MTCDVGALVAIEDLEAGVPSSIFLVVGDGTGTFFSNMPSKSGDGSIRCGGYGNGGGNCVVWGHSSGSLLCREHYCTFFHFGTVKGIAGVGSLLPGSFGASVGVGSVGVGRTAGDTRFASAKVGAEGT